MSTIIIITTRLGPLFPQSAKQRKKTLQDVFSLQIWIFFENLFQSSAGSDQSNDGTNRYAQFSDAWFPTHDSWIDRYSFKFNH